MRVERPLLLLLAALISGCADPEPFVDYGYTVSTINPSMTKPVDTVLETGYLNICYSDETPWQEVLDLAAERCGRHGLKVHSNVVTRWQCRATSPHKAQFRCYDPEMVYPGGLIVNPFDERAVRQWESQTGKTAKAHNPLTRPGLPAPTRPPASGAPAQPVPTQAAPAADAAAQAPAPAPVVTAPPPAAPVRPLTPADIADRPPMPPLPPRQTVQPPPAAGEAYPSDGFTLPQGSWGDHFQD